VAGNEPAVIGNLEMRLLLSADVSRVLASGVEAAPRRRRDRGRDVAHELGGARRVSRRWYWNGVE
jgi:hypothetical protein